MPKQPEDTMEIEEEKEFISFEVEKSLKRQLETMAERTERSLSAMVRLIIKQYLDGKGQF